MSTILSRINRQPVYYVDLTLRDGIHLQEAIQTAKEIDQQSKQAGFNQNALDQMARQGFANARFEVNSDEGLDVVDEFYADEKIESENYSLNQKIRLSLNLIRGMVSCKIFIRDYKKV